MVSESKEMPGKITEIRWHSRGGQGAKTAAGMVAEVAVDVGKYGQGCPEYGAERAGAPMKAYTRVSEEPINVHCGIETPDVLVIVDETLIGVVDCCEGVNDACTVIVNTGKSPAEIRAKLGLKGGKVYTIDATQLAIDTIGRPIPNTPMLGALVKATGVLALDDILNDVKKKFGGKFSQKVIDGNLKAVQRAYEEVQGDNG